ncbi:hypothetical protein RHO14_06645 [Orbus wheelerorum]|uniref:hypothetical protein n=1 Tax=Orbus wheelerorum TaxID=3074111 RepID=UPI00370D8A91
MFKKFFVLITIIILITISLKGCVTNSNEVRIVGKEMIKQADITGFSQISLQIDDYYDPFLSKEENNKFLQNLDENNIKITATYEPIIDKTKRVIKRTQIEEPKAWSSSTNKIIVTDKINQVSYATNLKFDNEQRIITFTIPKPVNNKEQEYVLSEIYLNIPIADSPAISASTYIDKFNKFTVFENKYANGQLLGMQDRFQHRRLNWHTLYDGPSLYDKTHWIPIEIGRYIALNTTLYFEDKRRLKNEVLSEQERQDLFDDLSTRLYGYYVNLNIPETLPNWFGVDKVKGAYINSDSFEIIQLNGNLPNKNDSRMEKNETWIIRNGVLMSIYQTYYGGNDCEYNYKIVFEQSKNERKYIEKKVWLTDKNKWGIEKKYITRHNFSKLDETKKEKELYYESLKDSSYGADYVYEVLANKRPQCMRIINDSKLMFGASKEELNILFNEYKKIIMNGKNELHGHK